LLFKSLLYAEGKADVFLRIASRVNGKYRRITGALLAKRVGAQFSSAE